MTVLLRVTVESGGNEVDVGAVFLDAAGAHAQDGHVRAVHDVLDARVADDLRDGVLAAVGAEVIHEIRRLVERFKGIADVFFRVSPADVRDDQADVRELLLDLHDLREIDGVLQPPVARDVEHHDRAHLVHLLQLRLREEVKDTDLRLGDILGGKAQISLDPEEAALADLPLHLFRGFLRRAEIQRREAGPAGGVGHVVVGLLAAAGVGEHEGGDVLARQHQPVGLLQILNGIVRRHKARPGDRALDLARGEGLRREEFLQIDVRMHVQDLLRQKILQFLLVDFAVVGFYFE